MNLTASPSVRAYAAKNGVNLADLAQKIGRKNIAREDVDRFLQGISSSSDVTHYWKIDHTKYGRVTTAPFSRIAQLTAANLTAANAMIPQVTHHDSADMRAINSLRKRFNKKALQRGTKLTALAFHVKVLARCLDEFPLFNTSISADGETLFQKHYIHIGIAVDTPYGLLVPVIRDVDEKGIWQIADEIVMLSNQAQKRKIQPDQMGGASMTISNLGGIGGRAFTPIVNPPEVAILGLTRIRTEPVWDGTSWQPVPMVPIDLSYDHRVINGVDAARFVSRYADLISEPRHLII